MSPSPFSQIYADHAPTVRRSVARLLPEPQDVDDVVQDTFLRAYLALPGRSIPDERLRAWLVTIGRNRACDVLRSRRAMGELGDCAGVARVEPPAVLEQRERLDDVVAAVMALPPSQRQALVRHALDGVRYDHVGAELRVTTAAAKSLAWRARDTIRRDLSAF